VQSIVQPDETMLSAAQPSETEALSGVVQTVASPGEAEAVSGTVQNTAGPDGGTDTNTDSSPLKFSAIPCPLPFLVESQPPYPVSGQLLVEADSPGDGIIFLDFSEEDAEDAENIRKWQLRAGQQLERAQRGTMDRADGRHAIILARGRREVQRRRTDSVCLR